MNQNSRELAGFFLEGNIDEALRIVRECQRDSTSLEVFSSLFTPAMNYIGELWENSEINVADEHLATAVCDMVLSQVFPGYVKGEKVTKKAMLLCLEGEQHYLGLKMINRLFEENDWATKYFGSNLPLEYAVSTAVEWKPSVIALSVSIVYHLPKLKEYVMELESLPHKPLIIVGGRLAGKYDLRPYCSENTLIMNDITTIGNWLGQYQLGEKVNAI
ncbi:B12-binding domain-containing protein [Fictibacillus aquaticus]|uniref:cobalamin B12-binding domain-containing protein n=1 Tax=Fictibacillus aquaticus TaxID=2021314 RepID=UPI001F0A86FF|nr:B12-binding domain-containing protein [Fictibacillus aquaticus]